MKLTRKLSMIGFLKPGIALIMGSMIVAGYEGFWRFHMLRLFSLGPMLVGFP